MPKLPRPSVLYWDMRVLYSSTIMRHRLPRLPDVPPEVEAFWVEHKVATEPLLDWSAPL
jgi:hypothetical protein